MTNIPEPDVRKDRHGAIAVLTIDNPPVNALGHAVREMLHAALCEALAEAAISGVVIACAGRTFVAGADIGEFGTPKQFQSPRLIELCSLLDGANKPVAAAIHGTALGGGLELALACHFRIADRNAKLGLPEVKLGLMPGAGGTVRLPRLIGPETALSMIATGAMTSAEDAMASGLVDALADGDVVAAAIAFLDTPEAATPTPVRHRDEKLAETRADPAHFESIANGLLAKARGQGAPRACVEAVRNAINLPFDEALAKEREAFLALAAGDESKALRHLFFAERETFKVPGMQGVTARPVARVGIVGAGTMGGGIAMAFANAGYSVTVLEQDDAALSRGLQRVADTYDASVKRGSLVAEERERRLSAIRGTTDIAALADCDLIIEAVFEDMGVKQDLLRRLDVVARPGCILATNTSYLDVNAIAAVSSRPQDVIGLHFFSPANVMKLLEIVRAGETAPDVVQTALGLARKLGKIPVVVGVCHGFVGNRMLAARNAENEYLLLEGATPAQVDAACRAFGWSMGPFQVADLAGLDISWRNRKAQGKTAAIADAMCERGWFGQKAGRGYYIYEEGSRMPKPDPEVLALIEAEAERQGIQRRAVPDDEIIERTLYPMINEGWKILAEGIAARASDIDLVWVNGYGFPATKGGPMHWAEARGADYVRDRLAFWKEQTGRSNFDAAPST